MNNNSERNIILIVDDHQTNLNLLFQLLRNVGFKVLISMDGESAIEQTYYAQPDLILLDVMMPGIDGFETCRQIKSNPSTCDIPIIFMTALSDTENKVKGFQYGAVDYITKPFQYEEVISRVQTHITMQKLRQSLKEKNQELSDLNNNLERLVEQKTRELNQREKAAIVGRLTQGMVHNLKNPIQTIQTCTDLIEIHASKLEEETVIECINYINVAVKNINQIMDNLMAKSRSEQYEERVPVNLNLLLQRELKLLEANLHFKHQIRKTYSFDETLPSILLIDSHISQIFHNLINNAIDSMWQKHCKELRISTQQDSEKIYLEIQDSGCGIAPENLSKIFDPFYTSKPIKDSAIGDEPTGTGLGLYTCLELLRPFQGEITVKSELNQGSTFIVILPKPSSLESS
ncbi:hybrid sensor histidine kinase/response regulator [Kamptonema cortianum]|uniref:histidine kinase n=1 Tax=Geitlerinema calcuttense NRMC-F 0142 TaxID=2922238 RepID=A0ABT7LVS8_9CYAN|nr:hybrid sensor histidine kinase/response regulator [Geitlerinema calcuttense]MDI9638348.1 hybrid sensor histidine kinase/response regulator [Geitlerinema splendidum]MDK3155806.1 hybrid sensor histidine kinase/response regulator [Kamptonema cortianum]MDL5045625.1 hybrid sensor histidine kinase/response regulator [Oscillatoria amoena NRMC-F 0135]MDL5056141.1 hybrid sensor histidine kinase/response regulator [Geitlerinema calcuttense NRMC-F 0142]